MGAALAGAVGGAVAAATSKAISTVMGAIDGAVRRVDVMRNFPKIMENLGYSAGDAAASIKTMSDRLTGLPTSLDAMAGSVQQLAPLTGSLASATDLSLALNNALLAGGKSTSIQTNALEQYTQMLSVGKVDLAAFKALVTAMPGQLGQLSQSLLGAGSNWTDLYAAMQDGRVSFDQFNAAILDLNQNGLAGYASFAEQAKDATKGIGTAQENLGTAVTRGLANLIDQFQPQITAALAAVTDAVNATFKSIVTLVNWVKDNTAWLGPLVVGVGSAAVAFGGLTLAVNAWKAVQDVVAVVQAAMITRTYGQVGATYALEAATKAGAVAQNVMNAAFKVSPIGLIVTAITALVGALTWFFTQTELGKTIWAEFTRFLGEAWTNISGFFTAAWVNVIQPTFQAIGAIAVWLYETILKPVFDGIAAVVGFVAGLIKLNFDLTVNAFRLVGAIANWLWVNALQPAFNAIGQGIAFLWTTFVQPYFNLIGGIFQWVWVNIISPIVGWIGDGLQVLGLGFKVLYESFVKPAWDGISGALQAGWSWIDQYVFTPFKMGIDLIARGFEVAKAAIEKTWDGIRKAAAVPINFVLGTVWNDGLRSFWNDVVGTLGLNDMKLAAAPLVKFASGGVLPGYTPGRDVHEFYSPTGGRLALSGGEAIMRPEFTRAVGGPAGVARLNAMARNGGLAFKDGGVFDQIGQLGGDIWTTVTGAVGRAMEFITNPGQAIQTHIIDGLLRPLLAGGPNPNIFQKTVGQLPINLMEAMIEPLKKSLPAGRGTEGMGWQAMWQLVQAAIPGATFNDGPRPPGTLTNTGSVSYHSLGRAIDIGPATMDTFNRALALFPTARELIFSPAGGRQLLNGQPHFWTGVNRDIHWDHVHIAMANGGVFPGKAKLYDQGGWLPHGGVAVNRSGRPEAVLNPDESAALRSGLGGLRPGDSLRLVVDGYEFSAFVQAEAGVVAASRGQEVASRIGQRRRGV